MPWDACTGALALLPPKCLSTPFSSCCISCVCDWFVACGGGYWVLFSSVDFPCFFSTYQSFCPWWPFNLIMSESCKRYLLISGYILRQMLSDKLRCSLCVFVICTYASCTYADDNSLCVPFLSSFQAGCYPCSCDTVSLPLFSSLFLRPHLT